MARQAFLRQHSTYPPIPLCPCLPLTPASLLYKERKLLNFCSRDYLGLSQHAELRKSAIKYLLHYGTGICDPEVANGYLECQRLIEEKCAEALCFSHARLFSTTCAAMTTILQQFSDRKWTLFIDAASQAPLLKAAQQWGGKVILYPHRDLNALDALLSSCNSGCLILSESLFAATGHVSDLNTLIHLARKNDAFLIVDDSRAFGVKGKQGFGLTQGSEGIDFILCGLDCAAGASGTLAACSESIGPYFFNEIPFVRDHALCFSALGAIEAAFDLIPTLEGERMQLEQRTHWIRQQLKAFELSVIPSSSHLIAIACDNVAEASHRYNVLLEHEILSEVSIAQREPEESYLLLAINAYHTPDELSTVVQAFETADHSLET